MSTSLHPPLAQVDAFFSGHDHCLQLIPKQDPSSQASTMYVVSGAGSDIKVGELQQVRKSMISL